MCKNIFKIVAVIAVLISANVKAQVTAFSEINTDSQETNYFLDASLMQDKVNEAFGKLLGFPKTDLTIFRFIPDNGLAQKALNFFDGVIVYNSATGKTITGQPVDVTPGFYYFSNPGGTTETTGKWIRFGSGEGNATTVDIVNNSENITNITIDGKPVYSYKGSFVADGTKTQYNLATPPNNFPSGITGIYKVTIYNTTANIFTNTVYSLSNAGALVTGSPNISVIYPSGTYYFILEYLK